MRATPHRRTAAALALIGAACLVPLLGFSGQATPAAAPTPAPASQKHFVGSESCKGCHAAAYNGWKQTRMANVVRDPKEHPEAVLGDFAHPTAAVTFKLS